MKLHDFIFLKKRNYRVSRHVAFWLCWIVYSGSVQLTGMQDLMLANASVGEIVWFQLARALNRLPPQIFFTYVTVYYLVPRFIPTKKYFLFVSLLLLAFFISAFGSYWIFKIPGGLSSFLSWHPRFDSFISFFYPLYSNFNFTGAVPACCVMLTIKYYKDWYRKERESELLQRENKLAELQLLKAQIHPHFLFNTLNNIYSFTLTGSPRAADLIDKLSGMIDYITKEGEKSFVPLDKEIQLIRDYLGLEKVRYGNRLDMQVSITGNCENKVIAPLLLIPFVENCFKHGASLVRGQQWLELKIEVNDDKLVFFLANSKPFGNIVTNGKKGIGLSNVQKRLDLIYPGDYSLGIESTDDSYMVQMTIRLHQSPVLDTSFKQTTELQTA